MVSSTQKLVRKTELMNFDGQVAYTVVIEDEAHVLCHCPDTACLRDPIAGTLDFSSVHALMHTDQWYAVLAK